MKKPLVRSLQKKPVVKKKAKEVAEDHLKEYVSFSQPPGGGDNSRVMTDEDTITLTIARKYSVRPYETMDVNLMVSCSCEPGETQHEATMRVFEQMKTDMIAMGEEVRELAKKNAF